MHALYDGVVSFFSFQLPFVRMDLISFRRKEWAWGEVKVAAPPLPPAGDNTSGFLMVHSVGSQQDHFQNGDKKRESNGVILRYRGQFC